MKAPTIREVIKLLNTIKQRTGILDKYIGHIYDLQDTEMRYRWFIEFDEYEITLRGWDGYYHEMSKQYPELEEISQSLKEVWYALDAVHGYLNPKSDASSIYEHGDSLIHEINQALPTISQTVDKVVQAKRQQQARQSNYRR